MERKAQVQSLESQSNEFSTNCLQAKLGPVAQHLCFHQVQQTWRFRDTRQNALICPQKEQPPRPKLSSRL